MKIIDLIKEEKINKLIVAHKDRLARFGYDLIEYMIKTFSNGEIIIINQKDEIEPEEEMIKDVLQITNVRRIFIFDLQKIICFNGSSSRIYRKNEWIQKI